MQTFEESGSASLDGPPQDEGILATSVSTVDVMGAIGEVYRNGDYVSDPHTAVGLVSAARFATQGAPVVCVATAHPAKFPESVCEATGKETVRHDALEALRGRPTRRTVIQPELEAIKGFIESHAS